MPDEYGEAGRVTALAYREFVAPGEAEWEDYLQHIADVESRAGTATVFVAVLAFMGWLARRGVLPRTRVIVPGELAVSD